MADLRLVPISSPDIITLDLLLTPFGLDETKDLQSAVLLALCTDSLAAPEDTLPWPNSTDRRGWWGDYHADTIWGGWELGSKCWLLKRAKITDADAREGATVARAQAYIAAAMQPFIEQKICSQVTVDAWRHGRDRIYAKVIMYRGPLTLIALEFQALWDQLGN